jgi:hypothetical protein
MVINKMTWASKRDDRIQVHLRILDSLVSMLNAQESPGLDRSKRHKRSIGQADFHIALRNRFDNWIQGGKVDTFTEPGYRPLHRDTLLHHLDENGIAQFSLDFRRPDGAARLLDPEDDAEMWFRLFLDQDGQRLLSKCSKCLRYFLRKRLPKGGGDPKREDFCLEHRSQVRMRSTRISRERKLDGRLRSVVELRRIYDLKKRAMPWKEWVRDEFNARPHHHSEKPITMAWITRHQKEIERRVISLGG